MLSFCEILVEFSFSTLGVSGEVSAGMEGRGQRRKEFRTNERLMVCGELAETKRCPRCILEGIFSRAFSALFTKSNKGGEHGLQMGLRR